MTLAYSEAEFVKMCTLMAAALVCPDKQQAFANASLSGQTVVDRVTDLDRQLKEGVKSLVFQLQ